MSSKFAPAREALMAGTLDWMADTFRLCLLAQGTAIDFATMEFLADIPEPNRVVSSDPLTGKAITDGYAISASAAFLDFLDLQGRTVDQAVLYKDTGSAATSLLVVHYASGEGLRFVGAGRNYFVAYTSAIPGWFRP